MLEKYLNPVKDRFKIALMPSILMVIITNVYISGIILYANYPILLLSPVIGTIVFLLIYLGLSHSKLNAKLAFILGAYTVATEVIIHSFCFGWNAGFYFFLFLLILVFLLESNWKIWATILFNLSIFSIIIGLNHFLKEFTSNLLNETETTVVAFMNGTLAGIIAVTVIVYTGRNLNRRDQLLLDIISDLEESNRKIAKQHDHQKILLKEIHHRVKNNLQIISSLLSLQSRNLEDGIVLNMLNESRSRVEAIALIHKKLYQDELGGNSVDFKSYLEDFIVKQSVLNPRIKFNLHAEELILHLDIAVPLGLIVSELITNSVKHAFHAIETPELTIELIQLNKNFELWVRDNGNGLPSDFDLHSGDMGLGSDIIIALTEQIDAELSYYNINGASFKILFQNRALE